MIDDVCSISNYEGGKGSEESGLQEAQSEFKMQFVGTRGILQFVFPDWQKRLVFLQPKNLLWTKSSNAAQRKEPER
jgi:hypothetical protein